MMERFNNNNNNISIIRIAFLMHALFHCGTCAQSLDTTTTATTIVHADADADADNYEPSYPSVSDLDSIDADADADADATNYNVSKVILSYLILSTWIIAVLFFFIALRKEIHTFFAKCWTGFREDGISGCCFCFSRRSSRSSRRSTNLNDIIFDPEDEQRASLSESLLADS